MTKRKQKKGLKWAGLIGGVLVIAVIAGVVVYQVRFAQKETESVYKETSADIGSLTVGITESGTVSIGTVEQEFDLDGVSATLTTASSSSSGSTASTASSSSTDTSGSSAGSGSSSGTSVPSGSSSTKSASTSAATQSTVPSGNSSGSSSTSSAGGSSSSTTSTATNADLVVEQVYVAAGQTVQEGDSVLKLTQDSIDEYREELESVIKTAQLNLQQAQLDMQTSQLSAQYSYESNVATGSVAYDEYQATITSLENSVTQAQTALSQSAEKIAEAQQKIADGEDYADKLQEEQENYTTLQANLTTAKNNLTTGKITAKQTYDEAMLNYENASSILAIDTDGLSDQVEEANETLTDAQTALVDFDSYIGDGILRADCSGTIMEIGYAAGDSLSTSTNIATYADADSVTMTVSVSQEDISQVTVGNEVNIVLTAYEDEVFKGQVSSIETTTASGSSTVNYSVTVTFTGETSKVYSGMTGDVTFITKEVNNVLRVSNKAIINEGTASYVKVKKEDGTIEKQKVSTGFSDGINVEITDGLTEGETVLIESQVTSE